MSVKRYWSYAGGDSSMQETETGNYVKYEDYASIERKNIDMAVQLANAESKCRELAAENAGLKKFCEDAAFDADYESELLGERGGFVDGLSLVKTQATDAFLAEVRAQGVEMLADELLCPDLDEHIRGFASQLRKGAAL